MVITVIWNLIKFNDMTFCKHITSVLLKIYSFMKKYFTLMVYLASLLHRLFTLIWNVPCVTTYFYSLYALHFFFIDTCYIIDYTWGRDNIYVKTFFFCLMVYLGWAEFCKIVLCVTLSVRHIFDYNFQFFITMKSNYIFII